MAKKSKTPAPPRVQAPRRREGSRPGTGSADSRRLLMLGGLAAAGVAALAGIFVFLSVGGDDAQANDEQVQSTMEAAGCTFTTAAAKPWKEGQVHISEGTKVTWPTDPPAAGPHYDQTAVWGFYNDAVDPRHIVHNLEHGGVALWWGPDTPQQTVEEMRAFYESDQLSMFGTQIASLGSKVAVTAWTGDQDRYGSEPDYYGVGKAAVCEEFDRDAFRTFRDAYRGKGPEPVEISQNQPGT